MDSRYDIYIVEHVEQLKLDYAELRRRFEEVVNENAVLNAQLDSYRRGKEEDYGWMNG